MEYRVHRLVRYTLLLILSGLVKKYRISAQLPREVKDLKPPYLFLGNHVGFWDPFIGGYFLPHHIHFISSELVLTNPVFRSILRLVKTIPIKKNTRDSQSIRTLIQYIRHGRCVGLYPEGSRTWSGTTLPFDPSIIKLIRFLKVPVVVCRLKGMHLSNPRWARGMRKCRVEVDYQLLFTSEEVKTLSPDKLFIGLQKGLHHDEVNFQKERMYPIHSNRRAEHINHALFLCPSCEGIDSFHSSGNEFDCQQCGYGIRIDRFGFFQAKRELETRFDNIRDWYDWQEQRLMSIVLHHCKVKSENMIFCDEKSEIFTGDEVQDVRSHGVADLCLFVDRLEVRYSSGKKLLLDYPLLHAINAQHRERLEIYYEDRIYRFIGNRPGVSALKWDVAVNAIWRYLGLEQKCSAYIRRPGDHTR